MSDVAYSNNSFPGLVRLNIDNHVLRPVGDSTFKFLGIYITPVPANSSPTPYQTQIRYVSDTICFSFYRLPDEAKPVKQLHFYLREQSFTNDCVENNLLSWFHPEILDGDTSSGFMSIYLLCKSKNNDWLEVIINKETGHTMWIKNDRKTEFMSWRKLFRNDYTAAVRKRDEGEIIIYDGPDSTSDKTIFVHWDCFNITRRKGNWLQVDNQSAELCDNNESHPLIEEKWILFKNDNGLLVSIITWY